MELAVGLMELLTVVDGWRKGWISQEDGQMNVWMVGFIYLINDWNRERINHWKNRRMNKWMDS